MADIEFRGMMDMPPKDVQQAHTVGKIINVLGAIISAALIVGIAVWGYNLLVRDVSGVPIVRAMDGPMRIQPDDPGGKQTAHQGLSVNRVQAEGLTEPTADRLVLAPATADVLDDDIAGIRRPPPAPPRDGATPMTEAADAEAIIDPDTEISSPVLLTDVSPADDLPQVISDGEGVVVALAPVDVEMSATDQAVAAALDLADEIAAEASPFSDIVIIPASVAGVSRSLRPIMRPNGLSTTPSVGTVEDTAARMASTPDVDPATIVAGTRLAQLGAFDTVELAQQEWDSLYHRFTEYMEGKSRVVQRAESGGRTFYRLRVMGFDDLSDARSFCSVLLAENADCIPVKVR